VEELMSHPAICIPAEMTLAEVADQYLGRYRYAAFPVIDAGGSALGLLSLDQLEHTPVQQHAGLRAGELADRDPALMVDRHEDLAELLDRSAFARAGRAIVIDLYHRPIGIVSITDVQRSIRASRIRNTPSSTTRLAPR
jgi:predicted transcriptional regulator